MKVELINKEEMKDFFKKWGTVSAVCYDTDPKYAEKIGKGCLKSGHFSGSRGLYFMFKIEGISRACSMQLNRHEVGVMKNQRSQRYCNEENFQYVIPPIIQQNHEACNIYISHMRQTADVYKHLQKLLTNNKYNKEQINQDIRYVLPEGTYTQGVWGFTLEALINLCHKRLCNRSQWEIKELTKKMRDAVVEILPELDSYLVPQCGYLKRCPEGKSSCRMYKGE